MRYFTFCVFAVLTVQGADLQAQRSADLVEGMKIRVEPFRGKTETGSLVAIGPDSLTYLRSGKAVGRGSVGLGDVKELSISRGTKGMSGFMSGGAKWALYAGAVGAVIGAVSYTEPKPCFCIDIGPSSRGASAGVGALLFAIPGFLIGGLNGRGDDRWTPVTFR